MQLTVPGNSRLGILGPAPEFNPQHHDFGSEIERFHGVLGRLGVVREHEGDHATWYVRPGNPLRRLSEISSGARAGFEGFSFRTNSVQLPHASSVRMTGEYALKYCFVALAVPFDAHAGQPLYIIEEFDDVARVSIGIAVVCGTEALNGYLNGIRHVENQFPLQILMAHRFHIMAINDGARHCEKVFKGRDVKFVHLGFEPVAGSCANFLVLQHFLQPDAEAAQATA